jgi:ketosteroid isomerase-like protein
MYHAFVRRRVRSLFEETLTNGDWQAALADVADEVRHSFPGDHPLGGERRSRASVERWFERLGRLFPGHRFEVERVAVRGSPWSTWVAVQWTAELTPVAGRRYRNDGSHWIHIRWGTVTVIHAYLDTQLVAAACAEMAAAGVEEAAAPPIVDSQLTS